MIRILPTKANSSTTTTNEPFQKCFPEVLPFNIIILGRKVFVPRRERGLGRKRAYWERSPATTQSRPGQVGKSQTIQTQLVFLRGNFASFGGNDLGGRKNTDRGHTGTTTPTRRHWPQAWLVTDKKTTSQWSHARPVTDKRSDLSGTKDPTSRWQKIRLVADKRSD